LFKTQERCTTQDEFCAKTHSCIRAQPGAASEPGINQSINLLKQAKLPASSSPNLPQKKKKPEIDEEDAPGTQMKELNCQIQWQKL
jgi:hypothetical protein